MSTQGRNRRWQSGKGRKTKQVRGKTLMDLPTELRRVIFMHVLVDEQHDIGIYQFGPKNQKPERARPNMHGSRAARQRKAPSSVTPLFFVNKTIHTEASQIFYGHNSFCFNSTTAMSQFLTQIGTQVRWLRSLKVEYMYIYDKMQVDSIVRKLVAAKDLRYIALPYEDVVKHLSAEGYAKQFGRLLRSLKRFREKENMLVDPLLHLVDVHWGWRFCWCQTIKAEDVKLSREAMRKHLAIAAGLNKKSKPCTQSARDKGDSQAARPYQKRAAI